MSSYFSKKTKTDSNHQSGGDNTPQDRQKNALLGPLLFSSAAILTAQYLFSLARKEQENRMKNQSDLKPAAPLASPDEGSLPSEALSPSAQKEPLPSPPTEPKPDAAPLASAPPTPVLLPLPAGDLKGAASNKTDAPASDSLAEKPRLEKRVREVTQRVIKSHSDDFVANTEPKMKKEHLIYVTIVSLFLFLAGATALILVSYHNEAERRNIQQASELDSTEEGSSAALAPLVMTEEFLLEKEVIPAKEAIVSFLKARRFEEAKPYVGEQSEALQKLEQYFKRYDTYSDLQFGSATRYKDEKTIVNYTVKTPDGQRGELLAYSEPDGTYRVDWRSLYLCETMPFREYARLLPTTRQSVWAYAMVDTFYSDGFPEKNYQSIKLTDFQGQQSVFAYIRRDSPRSARFSNAFLETNLELGGKPVIRAILAIRLVRKGPLPIVEILDVPSTDWDTFLLEEH